jgi:hypothetical protein
MVSDAVLRHGAGRKPGIPGNGLFLQVFTTAGWRNVQNPKTGGVMAVTNMIVGQTQTALQLFDWACNSVQMARDLKFLASCMASDAMEAK